MNKIRSLSLMLAALAMSSDLGSNNRGRYTEPKETEEERKKRIDKAEIEINKSKGLTKFNYGSNSLWALNQKSADKKAKKKGWT